MTTKTYTTFDIDDFLNDADFIRLVKYQHSADLTFWNNWQQTAPENLSAFNEAKLQLQAILSAEEIVVPPHFKVRLLDAINQSINTAEKKKQQKKQYAYLLSGAAASVFFGLLLTWYFTSTIVVHAGYAENKIVHLPDGSEVQLNANSTLRYSRAFNWKNIRQVNLEGEAYFKVIHLNASANQIKKGEIFIAATKAVRIQVLGTEFNVKERHQQAEITLVKGKIGVMAMRSGKQYIMRPGEHINFDQHGQNIKTGDLIDHRLAWLSGKLIVNQTSVNAILREFEDLYGYKVVLDSAALGNKKIDGTISIKNEESLLFTLKNILNVDILKDGKTIYLKNRK